MLKDQPIYLKIAIGKPPVPYCVSVVTWRDSNVSRASAVAHVSSAH